MPAVNTFTVALLALAGTSLLVCAGAVRADDGCKSMLDATKKVILAPTHLYSTNTAAYRKNVPESSEAISTGGADGNIYVMVHGKWTRSKIKASDMLKQEEENDTPCSTPASTSGMNP